MTLRTKIDVVCGTIVLIGLAGFGGTYLAIRQNIRESDAPRVQLLCETDFPALLGACRELSRRVASGDLKSGTYVTPDTTQFPEPIATLRPERVTISENGVVDVLVGLNVLAKYRFGAYAYPEGYANSPLGDRKLIEGLWYYDMGYQDHADSYDKKIEQLLAKSGKLKQP
jgi:hypothetical protein